MITKILSNTKAEVLSFHLPLYMKKIRFGVWFDWKLGKIFVSNDYLKNYPFTFACTLDDHTPNTMFLSSCKKYSCWKTFIDNYNLGNVRFENSKIKYIVQDLIKQIMNK